MNQPAQETPYNVACHLDHYHQPRYDAEGKLLPWLWDEHGPFHSQMRLISDWWLSVPQHNGWPIWCTAAKIRRNHEQFGGAVPACTCAMTMLAFVNYYQYTGEPRHLALARLAGDFLINQALTPSHFRAWPRFPWPAGKTGDPNPDGSGHPFCSAGQIMPDKGAMAGLGLVRLYQAVGDSRYLQAAQSIARVLVANAVASSPHRSAWPFRAEADSGKPLDGPLCGNQMYVVRLLDALLELNALERPDEAQRVRNDVWLWLENVVIADQSGDKWQHFFEDHSGDEDNATALSALETAKYLLNRREALTPNWQRLVHQIIQTVEGRWTVHEGSYRAIAEQDRDRSPYNSHTARLAAVYAGYFEHTGDESLKKSALSSLAYAGYSVNTDGFADTYYLHDVAWTTDSFGDLLIHFNEVLTSVPEWAPNTESHILRSSTILREVVYEADSVAYKAFDACGKERLKLAFQPMRVVSGSQELKTWHFDAQSQILEIERSGCSSVRVLGKLSAS
ncbi:MAG: hypothetical protein SFV15_26750 [Polyangiaceae bacterium]|nr:hypothetical protein [Polyangiaceae bacterium]